MLDRLEGRNGTHEFARRTLRNLEYVLAAKVPADVHPVTQIVSTLLGVIVFPWEKKALDAVKKKRLAITHEDAWPRWQMSGPLVDANKVKNVGDLIEQIRNAVAHGHVLFDSDSRRPEDVDVTFESYSEDGKTLKWRAAIRADKLAGFCRKFSEFVADYVS